MRPGATGGGQSHVMRLTPEAGKRIRVFRNGDAHHKGIIVVVNARQAHDIHSFLDTVSERIGLVLGAKRLFTLDGEPVTSTEQLRHNKDYVAATGPFTPLNYGNILSKPIRRSSVSAAIGNRLSADPLASSSFSKKSAPASLAEPAMRQSRSTEPRRGAGIQPPSLSRQRERERSTGGNSKREPSTKATEGGKGRRKKKGKEKKGLLAEELMIPTRACPAPAAEAEAVESIMQQERGDAGEKRTSPPAEQEAEEDMGRGEDETEDIVEAEEEDKRAVNEKEVDEDSTERGHDEDGGRPVTAGTIVEETAENGDERAVVRHEEEEKENGHHDEKGQEERQQEEGGHG